MTQAFPSLVLALSILVTGTPAGAAQQRVAPTLPDCLQGGPKLCFGPAEIRQAYDINPLLKRGVSGVGRTIAIVVSFGSPTIREDLRAFDQAFHLPDPRLDIRAPLGRSSSSDTGWKYETTLDVEWAHAMAPGARILLLTSPVDETEGTHGLPEFLALERYAVRHGADVISQSWAATEDTLLDTPGRDMVRRFHRFYINAVRRGVTFLGATGDNGASGLDLSLQHLFPFRVVQWPASDPLVLAVGGTSLVFTTSAREETAWRGSGGGFSKLYGEPAYQRLLPPPAQKMLQGRRGIPDVAWNAAKESAVAVYLGGEWKRVGGTSASTPQWAGLIALADNVAHHDLGDIHRILYRLAVSSRYHADFHDILIGSIADPPAMPAAQEPIRAAPGWDAATGLGSPIGAHLLSDLLRGTGPILKTR
ncbi:MAG: S53 family peptidase [Chloroflexota bacterium]